MEEPEKQELLVDQLVKRLKGALSSYDDDIQFQVLWQIIISEDELLKRLNETVRST